MATGISLCFELEEERQVHSVVKPREKGDFGEKGKFEDCVTLKFDDRDELYVSASFLKMASPVFTRMLESDFKEKVTRVIELRGKDHDDFLELLSFLHPGIQKKITEATVFRIIPIAEEYEVQSAISDGKGILNKLLNSAGYPDTQSPSSVSVPSVAVPQSGWQSRPPAPPYGIRVPAPQQIEAAKITQVNRQHCKSLCDCLKVLDVAIKYSYSIIKKSALVKISKYPSIMYTKKRVQDKDIDINCFEHYVCLSDKEKIEILTRRLDIQDLTCKLNIAAASSFYR